MSFPAGEVRQITDELNYYGNYGMGIMRDGSAIVADLWDTQAQLWAIDATGSTAGAEQLTNGTSDGSIGLAAMSDGQIVYSTRSGEDRDIWVLRDSGGVREGKPLTADPASEGGLCSPADGRFVVFASDREGSSHLFRITADGKDLKQITTGSGFESSPECSADGSFILFESGSRIWRVGSDGGEPVPLTDFECVAPSLSPDGEQFACIQPTHIQIKNATLAVVPVTGGPPVKSYDVIPFGFYYRPARWTPDGKGLLFKRTEKQIGNLWRQDVSGGPPRKISDFRSDSIFNHVYTADGKQLIVSRGKVAFNTVLIRNFD
jgi:dipeptidyl aminopeptidase/acylaminoacyl peptidase